MRNSTSRIFLPLALSLVIWVAGGCNLQDSNSFSNDATTFSTTPVQGTNAFMAVNAIVRTNCASCHTDFGGYTEAEWISNGLIVPGNPAQSEMWQYLSGTGANGPQDMPLGEAPLSSSDLQSIQTWIEGASASGS